MARIRTIKPEFWGDEKLAPMPAIDRLVFLGLLSFADDAGRLVDNVKAIDGFIFPESEDTARESLVRLAETGRILRYTSESGQRLLQVANWKKHQRIAHPSTYVLPSPPRENSANVSRKSREDSAKVSGDIPQEAREGGVKPSGSDLGSWTLEHGPTSTTKPSRRTPRGETAANGTPKATWLSLSCAVWESRFGAGSFAPVAGQAARALGPVLKGGQTEAQIAEHLRVYLEESDPKFVSLNRFAQTYAQWVSKPLVDEWGVLTEHGERVTRPDPVTQ